VGEKQAFLDTRRSRKPRAESSAGSLIPVQNSDHPAELPDLGLPEVRRGLRENALGLDKSSDIVFGFKFVTLDNAARGPDYVATVPAHERAPWVLFLGG
jgi:hypothetical protein